MKGDLFSSEHMVQPATQAGMTVENAKCIRYTVNGPRSYFVTVKPWPGTNSSSAWKGPLPIGFLPAASGSSKKASGSG